jgi:hypothetical protein
MKKQFSWFEIILMIVILSAYVYAAFSDAFNLPNRWFIRDDAYYYYKIAQNISEGHGSTFDGINQTNGYHPLWMLVCIPIFSLARFDPILPLRVLILVTGLFHVATTLILYRLVSKAISPVAGMLAAIYWAFESYILVFLYKTGVESTIALFFIVLLLYQLYKSERTWRKTGASVARIAVLGLLASLVTFGRLDLAFFALIVGISVVFRESPLRYLLPLDILAVVASTLLAFITRLGISSYYDSTTSALIMISAGLLIKIPILYLCGLYDRPSNWRPLFVLGKLLLAIAASSAVLSALLLLGGSLHIFSSFSRIVLLRDAGYTFGLVFLIRATAYAFRLRRDPAPEPSPINYFKLQWKNWLRDGAVYYGIVGGTLSIYMLWNKLVFGISSPVSGLVKRWWGTFAVNVYGGSAKTFLSFFAMDPYSDFDAWQPFTTTLRNWSNGLLYKDSSQFGNPAWQHNFLIVLVISCALMGLILLIRRMRTTQAVVHAGIIPLFVGSWLQILAYNITGYAAPKEWYWLVEPILLTIVAVLLINKVFEFFLKRWKVTRVLVWLLVAWFGFRTAYSYWHDTYLLNPYGQTPPNAPYMDLIPFLEDHTQPGDMIGMTGGGNVGYFIHDRTVVNMDGLVNSAGYFEALKNGTGADYLYNHGVRYVFANPDLLNSIPYRGQYTNRLEPLVSWGGKDLMHLLPKPSQ